MQKYQFSVVETRQGLQGQHLLHERRGAGGGWGLYYSRLGRLRWGSTVIQPSLGPERRKVWSACWRNPSCGSLLSIPRSWDKSNERCVPHQGGCYHEDLPFRSDVCKKAVACRLGRRCRVMVSPSFLQCATHNKSSFSSSSLLLKAFKWSSDSAVCQLGCLVAGETHTSGLHPLFLSHPPPTHPLERGSRFKAACSLVHSLRRLSAKSFLCCLCCNMAWKGERMGVVRAEGGKMSGLPHCCQGNLMSQ